MEIVQKHKGNIEQIISDMECAKDFVCHKSGFKYLGKAKLIAAGERVECLEENSRLCKFAFLLGSLTICECPLRNYIAKNFRL